jgi:hypothetical protein
MDADRPIRADRINCRACVHSGSQFNRAIKKGPDEKFTLDIPDRIESVNTPTLQSRAGCVEYSRFAQTATSADDAPNTP